MSDYERPKPIEPILPRSSSAEDDFERPSRSRSVFWPIILVGAGVLLLLSNMGIFPVSGWDVLWRFWPVLLIALGIDVVFGRRSLGGAVAGGVLILLLLGMAIGVAFFAEQIPFLVALTEPAKLQYKTVEHPLDDLKSAKVSVDWTSAPGYLSALADSTNLIEATVAYRGDLSFKVEVQGNHAVVLLDSYVQGVSSSVFNFSDQDSRWDVKLSPQVPLDLWLNVGSGSCDFDLTELDVENLDLDGGSGSLRLTLPETDNFEGKIDAGSGSMTLILPKGVGLRIELTDGSGSFNPDDRFRLVSGEADDDGVWETENYDKADYKITLEIDQGSGSLIIQ